VTKLGNYCWVLNAHGSVVALGAVMLMSRRLELDEIQMSLCGLAWLTCMQSVVAWRMLGECSTSCHHVMWSLGRPWYKTCTMWAFRHKRQWNYWGLSHPTLPILQWFTTLEEIKSTAQERAWLNGLQTAVQLVLANGDPMRMHWQT
jgi:hypothetical protein